MIDFNNLILNETESNVLYDSLRHWRKTGYHENDETHNSSYSIESKISSLMQILNKNTWDNLS